MRHSYIICSFVMVMAIARADASECSKALSGWNKLEKVGKFKSLLSNGLDMESDTIGYHGTSVESLLIALKTGFLPTSSKLVPGGGVDPKIRGLYFSPVAAQLPKSFKGKHLKDTHSQAAEIASGYAGSIAREIVFLRSFNIPFELEKQEEKSRPLRWLADSLEVYQWRTFSFPHFIKENADSINQFRLRKNVSDAELREAIEKSVNRKGVLLALSKSALSKYKMIDVYPDEGIFVQTDDQGLPLDAIVGLEPLGQFEWDTLSRAIDTK